VFLLPGRFDVIQENDSKIMKEYDFYKKKPLSSGHHGKILFQFLCHEPVYAEVKRGGGGRGGR